MKSLDDLAAKLAAPAADAAARAAEASDRFKAQEEIESEEERELLEGRAKGEEQARIEGERLAQEAEIQATRDKIASLASVKDQLAFVETSLLQEGTDARQAAEDRVAAERNFESKVAELQLYEKYGLTREELLTNPEYDEIPEVKAIKTAEAAEALHQSPSVGSEALQAKLAGLGVEVRTPFDGGTITSRDVSHALAQRERQVETEIYEARFTIPEERAAVVREIIDTKKVQVESINISQGQTFGEAGTYKGVVVQLEEQLRNIPACANNPEIKDAVMKTVVRDSILSQNRSYQEQLKNKRAYEDGLVATAEAEKALPGYLEAVTQNLYAPLRERLKKLDPSVQQAVLGDFNFKRLADQYSINYRTGEVVGLENIPFTSVPSPKALEAEMSRFSTNWQRDTGFDSVLKTLEEFEGVDYETYRKRARYDQFEGIKKALEQLAPKETIPARHPNLPENISRYEEVLQEPESVAERQAAAVVDLARLSAELRGDRDVRALQERDTAAQHLEAMRLVMSRLAGDPGRRLRIEGGKVIDVERLDVRAEKEAERTRLAGEGRQLLADKKALGERPKVFGPLNKKEASEWDSKMAAVDSAITRKGEVVASVDRLLTNTSVDVTRELSLPEELVRTYEGQQVSGRDLVADMGQRYEAFQPTVEALKKEAAALSRARAEFDRLSSQGFINKQIYTDVYL